MSVLGNVQGGGQDLGPLRHPENQNGPPSGLVFGRNGPLWEVRRARNLDA